VPALSGKDSDMTYRIHFEHADGSHDSFVVDGETVEQIRAAALDGVASRNGQNPWSERLDA
jgi:hypothetical protein